MYMYTTLYMYCSSLVSYETFVWKPILQTLTPLENDRTTILQAIFKKLRRFEINLYQDEVLQTRFCANTAGNGSNV